MAVEQMITDSSLSYAILRPTVFFGGKRDVLINNMAWLIRRFQFSGVFGMENIPYNQYTSLMLLGLL